MSNWSLKVRLVGQGRFDRQTARCDVCHQGIGRPAPKAGCPSRHPTLSATLFAFAKFLVTLWMLQAPRVWAQNFTTVEPELHTAAEAARERSARFWSGRPLPGVWSTPCPVDWSNRSGPGSGLTCFQIQNGEVFGWQMTLKGDRDTVLRDVIPHEVDHTVRASLCRRPLPRWLDEGCASLFESETSHDQLRQQRRLSTTTLLNPSSIDQLRYPASSEMTAQLYSEGFSLVEYLLSRGTPQDLLRLQLSAEPPSRLLVTAYRTELPSLFADWRSWEQQRLAAGTECGCVNCPWHKRSPSAASRSSSPIRAKTRPTLTIWTAHWCAPCQQFHRDLLNNSRFRSQLESRFQLVIRDVDQSPQLAAEATIRGVPVFITAERRVEGYLGPDWLLKQLGEEQAATPAAPAIEPPREPELPRLLETPSASTESPPPRLNPPPVPTPPRAAPSESGPAQKTVSFWNRILGLAPVVISVLTSVGVIGGTAVTGGIGGVALMLLLKILQRRATRSSQGTASAGEGGAAVPTRAPFPRELDEAGELLGLRQSEGRVATLDALRGMFLDDELDKLTSDPDPQVVNTIHRIRAAVDSRVDEVAPLTTRV